MAILKNGMNEKFTGRVGNSVIYLLNNKLVKRRIGKNLKPATVPQLASRQVTSIIANFLSPLNSFIQLGFELEAKFMLSKAYYLASSYNRLNAIAGTYPDQHVDFGKVLLTKGNMPPTLGIEVEQDEKGLTFTWDAAVGLKGVDGSDQVMLMAYLADKGTAIYLLNSARRSEGKARLTILKRKIPLKVETYISFVSKNHKSIANSIYTGQFSM